MMENIVRTAVALVSIACGSLWSFRADAQTTIPFLAPPARPSIDENNVDLVTGQVSLAITDLSIGQPGAGGLSYTRYVNASSATDEYAGVVTNDNTGCTFQSMTYFVTIGGSAFRFNRACPSGTTYTPTDGDGSTLTENASSFTYTARDGTVAIFSKGLGATGVWGALATITSLTLPDGEIRTYNYLTGMICRDASCSGTYPITRLQSVTNNRGYQIKYLYRISTTTNIPSSDYSNWFWITQVMGINMAVDYCDPFANACPGLTQSWPTASYNFDLAAMNTPYMLVYTVTDQLGGTRSYNGDISGLRVRWRNSSTDNVTYAFIPPTQQDPTPSYRVQSVTKNGRPWSYSYSFTGTERVTVVTDPEDRQSTYVFDATTLALKRYTNTANEVTTYENDSFGRATLVTLPTGETIHYQYDARGNITEKRLTSYPTGSPDLVWSAQFEPTCTASNFRWCNKPNWTRDPAGNQTDYTYDNAHGGVTSITLPAVPVAGVSIRPVTTYVYTPYAAYYKNSTGSLTAGSNVYYLTSVKQCRTTSGCADGSDDQLRTEIGYGASNVGNNRLPRDITTRNGTGTLIATTTTEYDPVGNVIATDGPLAGTVDRVVTRYDGLRRVTGTVSAYPNDNGRPYIGVHTIYNAQGLPETVETGTLAAQDAPWSSLVPAQAIVREFDTDRRVTKTSLVAGGSTYSVQQVSFDTLGRIDCTTTRMNPATFGSLPSACQPASDHPTFGPDRIIKYGYDSADRVTSVVSGYMKSPITERAMTYLPGGRLETLTDGKGNKTTYSYDPYGRLYRIYYPDPNSVGNSSTTDYEEFRYNANSQVTWTRRRSGDVIQTPRDALGRVTVKDLPGGTEDVSFSYDAQGRILSALYNSGTGITQHYDGLGRMDTRTVFGRQLGYQYDLAGRRTHLTYPDGFYVTYAYTGTDELKSMTDSAGALLATYSYDALGARVGLTRGNNSASTTYVPDAIKRLQELKQDPAGTGFDFDATFQYNPVGQITTKIASNDTAYAWLPSPPNSTVTAPVDGQNQLTSLAGTAVTDDANGNIRTGISSLTYTFDVLGQLRQATGGTTTVNVDYDPSGMLRRVTSGSAVTEYLYDGTDLVAQYDGNGNLVRRFIHGAGADEPLVSYDSSGNKTWLHADERGSIITATNASGTATASVKYSDYGEASGTFVSPFGYTGQLYLPELQLYYYKARMYSPKAGRFLQPDPIGYADGMNLYGYVANDPLNLSDPSGLISHVDHPTPPGPPLPWWPNSPQPDLGVPPDATALYTPPLIVAGPLRVPQGSCSTSYAYSQCMATCNASNAWIGNTIGGAVGGAVYGALMGARFGPQAALTGALAGLVGGGFAGAATSAFGTSAPVLTGLAGAAGSMVRNAGMGRNVVSGMAGGVTGGAINAIYGTPVSASIAGAAVGTVAGGSLSAVEILGTGAAGAVGGMAGMGTKAWVDHVVNQYCQNECAGL